MATTTARAEEQRRKRKAMRARAHGGLPGSLPSPIYGKKGASGIGQCTLRLSCGHWMRRVSGDNGGTRRDTPRKGSHNGAEACARGMRTAVMSRRAWTSGPLLINCCARRSRNDVGGGQDSGQSNRWEQSAQVKAGPRRSNRQGALDIPCNRPVGAHLAG